MKKIKKENLKIVELAKEKISGINFNKIFSVAIGIMLLFSVAINVNYLTKTPEVVEKEVTIEKEVIKYVEKQGGTTTDKFIVYLNSRIDPVNLYFQ